MKSLLSLLIIISVATCSPSVAAEGELPSHMLSASLRNSEIKDAIQGEIMAEGVVSKHVSARGGVSFFLSDDTGLHGGVEGGLRARLPGRLAPFVGAGMLLGQWTSYEEADNDGLDNDGDNVIDEVGEKSEQVDYLFAVYPEAGVQLWLSYSVRLTVGWRHYITSKGPGSNRTLFGGGIAIAF